MARADHAVSLNMSAAIAVGSHTVELPIRLNGRRVGVLSISDKGVQWNPSTVRPPVSVGWEDRPTALTSATSSSSTSAAASSTHVRRTAAPASRKRAAAIPLSTADVVTKTAPADGTGISEVGGSEAAAERVRPAGKGAAPRGTTGAALQTSSRSEATASEVPSLADTSASAAAAVETVPVEETQLPGALPTADTATDSMSTGTRATPDISETDSAQVPGRQPLPLGGLDTLDSTGAGTQIDIGASDMLTSVTESSAESDATTAVQPRGRRSAARKSTKKAPPRQAGE